MAIQFCKFQETLFRNIVVIDEYYYLVNLNALFSVTPCIKSSRKKSEKFTQVALLWNRSKPYGKYLEGR
jgi:hypothetical protein